MKKSKSFFAVTLCLLLSVLPTFAQHPTTKEVPTETPKSGSLEVLDAEAYSPKPISTETAPTIIAFGSCNKLSLPQNIWPQIVANDPQLWIWLGDIIYADTTNTRALAAHYKRLKTLPDYKKLRAKAQIIGVYDDHDYGINDGYKEHPTKKGAKKALMDFLDVPMNSPVRKREGAYNSYTFGKGDRSIKVIIMDTRYFRDSLERDPTRKRRYFPSYEGSILGDEQWEWLENELRTSTAGLNLLCSSVQVLSDEHPHEKWGNFPNERKRLLSLIANAKPKNLIILSGDRHMAEVSKINLDGLPYPLYDLTSSGLTHVRSGTEEPNRFRVGDLIVKRNFGILKVVWNNDRPIVTFQVRGQANELLQEIVLKF